jgi:2-iminoacetate synthase ThiH
MAGATSPQWQTEADMIKAIREAGLTPVQRDTFYEPIKILENVSGTEAMANSAPHKNAVQ